MKPKSTWYLLAALALSLGLAVAMFSGCGGDDDDDDDNDVGGSGVVSCDGDLCTVSGVIIDDLTFTSDKQWLLRGGVFVGDESGGTTLTIEPGTTIFGESSTNGMLVVSRGSMLMANGTAEAPIVFTSSKAEGSRARGDWGGLILNGGAPVNNCLIEDNEEFCESIGEGGTGKFGGTSAGDDSGDMTYVRVEFAGRIISPDNELNGIAFQGVGNGGTYDYLQVHHNKDDGVEFFGGTASVKHIVVTGVADDMLDWTDGWTGNVQYAVLQQWGDAGDQGIEADNNAEDNTASPRSAPTISNLTIVGVPGGENSDLGILLREGTAGNLSNIIVTGFAEGCLALDHAETFDNAWGGSALNGNLALTNTILDCDTSFVEPELDEAPPFTVEEFFNAQDGNAEGDPMLTDAFNTTSPNFLPADGSPALSGGAAPAGDFFEDAAFIGAMGSEDWTAGWTSFAAN